MSKVKVWLGGEGSNEIGDRDRPDGQRVGVLEALLKRVESGGWLVAGATSWQRIRKYKVRAALGRDNHGDIHNIAGLVNEAYEEGCEVVAFSRDVDADEDRAEAIARGITEAQALFQTMGIIGGPAIPAIEAWILALLNVPHTETMSRDRANAALAEQGIAKKHTKSYVDVIEKADLAARPPGCDAFQAWLAVAKAILHGAIYGAS